MTSTATAIEVMEGYPSLSSVADGPRMMEYPIHIRKTPEILKLESEIDEYDRLMAVQREQFIQAERHYDDVMDDLEGDFGRELERLRKADLEAKGEVQRKMVGLAAAGGGGKDFAQEEEDAENWSVSEMDSLWKEREKQLIEEYQRQEEQVRLKHQARVEELEAEIRILHQQNPEVAKQEGRPYYGLELQDHPTLGVRAVKSKGPAKDSGVKEGDIVVNLQASRDVHSKKILDEIAEFGLPGEHVALLIERNGVEHEAVLSLKPI